MTTARESLSRTSRLRDVLTRQPHRFENGVEAHELEQGLAGDDSYRVGAVISRT